MKAPSIIQLVETPLDQRANAYLRAELPFGHQLSRALVRELDLEHGVVTTLVPAKYGGDVYDFKAGGKLTSPGAESVRIRGGTMVPVSTSEADMARELIRGRQELGWAGVVFEDYYARRHHPWIERSHLNTVLLGENVYHTISASDPLELLVETMRRVSAVPHSLGVCSRVIPDMSTSPCAEWSDQDIDMIVRGTCGFIFGVYDGESYLFWRPA